jgi:hypothetical protein
MIDKVVGILIGILLILMGCLYWQSESELKNLRIDYDLDVLNAEMNGAMKARRLLVDSDGLNIRLDGLLRTNAYIDSLTNEFEFGEARMKQIREKE